jgi:hypothetical protein
MSRAPLCLCSSAYRLHVAALCLTVTMVIYWEREREVEQGVQTLETKESWYVS